MADDRTPRRYKPTSSVHGGRPEMFTTIEWDWSDPEIAWRYESLAIPVVDEDDSRALVCTLKADARGLNNGWVTNMPVINTDIDVFVDGDDPRNGNPPIEVDTDELED